MEKLWGGRFAKETDRLVDQYTASISFDKQLLFYDIEGSIAHVEMLGQCGILTENESESLAKGLKTLREKAEKGELQFHLEDEDIHMNVERALHEIVGPVAGKLHTARSRNDQVATDMHLYLRDKIALIMTFITRVESSLLEQAKRHVHTILPGYTHLQRAQPISFAHHLLAYFWMLERDKERFSDSLRRVNLLPLGAGALAGTTFPIDRFLTAKLLRFDGVYPNSIDAVSDRDFILEFLADASILMMHLSRLAEELVLWSSQEFQFIELDDAFCTGSSIMPQKKNPDVPELIRGKTGRVYGHLIGLLTVLKGLPLAYNKDLQEDKEGMFDVVNTLEQTLLILAPLLGTMTVKKERMADAVRQDYSNATDLADYLAKRGIPFREAHEITGRIVYYAIRERKSLLDLTLEEYRSFSFSFDESLYEAILPQTVMKARNSHGGTAPEQVLKQIEMAEERLNRQ